MPRRPGSARTFTLALALALAPTLTPSSAGASDIFQATRSERLRERAHTIDLVMAADRATMTVRRTVHNGGERHDQATFWIELPEAAVATGLRTLAMVKGKPVWYAGELMEAEAAAAKYRELTGIGGYYPKDPALLSWRSQHELALQVFPCPPAEDKTVEYTLTLPVEYVDGRSILRVSPLGTEAIAADIRVRPADRRDQVLVGGEPVPPGTRLRWPIAVDDDTADDTDTEEDDDDDDDEPVAAIDERLELEPGELLVSLARRDPPRLSGRVASVAVHKDRHLREFEVEAAPQLSATPRGAHVVVLIDISRSLDDEAIGRSIAAAQSALAGFVDARVEVIPFARRAEPLFGRFLEQKAAIAALEGLAPARENGSDVDVALARAGELLRRAPRGAPRRILVLTDTLTRASLTPERLRGALATTGALVHVGVPRVAFESGLDRDDAHDWAAAVRGTGGLVWDATISLSDGPRAAQRRRDIFEEWVRPLRIDHLKVVAPGVTARDLDVPETLDEGEGLRDLRLHAAALPWVRIEGELWAAPLREVFTADRDHGRLWAALVFGSELLGELSEAEMMPLAMLGGAVSPVTSYLAIEPGVRPSTEGLEEHAIGLGNIGLIGKGGGGGTGAGYRPPMYNHQAWIRRELDRLRVACSAPPIALTMETTRDEVVAVAVTARGDAVLDRVSARCVEEGVWAWVLPSEFRDRWRSFDVGA